MTQTQTQTVRRSGPDGSERSGRSLTLQLLRGSGTATGWLAVAAAVAGIGLVGRLLIPAALAAVTDALLAGRPVAGLLRRLIVLLSVEMAADLVGGYAVVAAGTGTAARLRRRLVCHVLDAGLPGARRFAVGDLTSRVLTSAASAGHLVGFVVTGAAAAGTSLLAIAALWLIDWQLALVLLAGAPIVFVLLRTFAAKATDMAAEYQRAQAAIAARLTDALTGARTIRASGTVDREARRVLQPLPRLREAGYAIWRTQRGTTWRVALLLPVLQLTVLAMAGLAAAQGRISAGQFLACAGYAGLGLAAFGQLDSLMELAVARSGLRRAAEVLDVAVTPTPGAPRALPDGPAEVRLRQVGARVPGAPVLTGVDLTIPAGATVALVGHSGAGKSTLAALVGRLYDPDEGAVLLDGVPVRAVPLAQLRRQVRYAFAEPVLLGRTVSDAIGYGCPDITPDAVRHAAEVACADAFIKRLPAGYDTPLSEAPLSGGETQRLGIARAVARAGRVMVLDDAMSNLDTATEQAVSVAIDRAIPDGTRLVVAHRLTTAARADLVAWLDGGRLRALAPHRELWHLPEYRRLFAADTGTATVDAPREAVR